MALVSISPLLLSHLPPATCHLLREMQLENLQAYAVASEQHKWAQQVGQQ